MGWAVAFSRSLVEPRRALVAAPAFVVLAIFLTWNNVPTALTSEDITYVAKIMRGRAIHAPKTYEEQIDAIISVQDAVLLASPTGKELPLGSTREPKDLFLSHSGVCYDRTRTIEKILTYLGIKNRHVAIYSTVGHTTLAALLTPAVPSHAVTEALTAKGWMAIDPNVRWIGLTNKNDPVSVSELHQSYTWNERIKARINPILTHPFVAVIGLYSRHGRFYPPYIPFPDINLWQMRYNITGS